MSTLPVRSPSAFGRRSAAIGIALAALALCAAGSCSHPPTQPDPPKTPPPPDTTSHNFSYTLDTLGTSGVLLGVAVINDSLVWAVGDIHTAETDRYDSSGAWVNPFNLAVWNGNE
jgi:hypothetical protein